MRTRLLVKSGRNFSRTFIVNSTVFFGSLEVVNWIFSSAPIVKPFRRTGVLTDRPMSQSDAWRMLQRRAKNAGIPTAVCNHTFRATGITAYLDNGGSLENAQAMAAHESPRTTKLYDRTDDQITLDEVEKIGI